MTVTRGDIEAEARRWVGTPFRHQGRTERGLDCAGFIIRVSYELGLAHEDWRAYGRQPDGSAVESILARLGVVVPKPKRGDVLLLRFNGTPQHLAIATERRGQLYIVHSHSSAGRVVEHRFDERWRSRLVRAYTWEEVADG